MWRSKCWRGRRSGCRGWPCSTTGYEALAQGEAGDREKAGRYRLLEIAQRDGMLPMARDWARGMVHPARLTDAALMEAIYSMIVAAGVAKFEAQIRALLARPDRTGLLKSLRLPTLVLCGRDDNWSPLARHEDHGASSSREASW